MTGPGVTYFKCRDYVTIGNVTSGSAQIFSGLCIQTRVWDAIGIYYTTGELESDTAGGVSVFYKAGDQFASDYELYSFDDGHELSLSGSGSHTGINVDVRVVRIEHPDMLNPHNMIVDFANKLPDITDTLRGI